MRLQNIRAFCSRCPRACRLSHVLPLCMPRFLSCARTLAPHVLAACTFSSQDYTWLRKAEAAWVTFRSLLLTLAAQWETQLRLWARSSASFPAPLNLASVAFSAPGNLENPLITKRVIKRFPTMFGTKTRSNGDQRGHAGIFPHFPGQTVWQKCKARHLPHVVI